MEEILGSRNKERPATIYSRARLLRAVISAGYCCRGGIGSVLEPAAFRYEFNVDTRGCMAAL